MSGRHVTDHQMRLFMKFRHNDGVAVAAARAGFSTATGYRLWNPSFHRKGPSRAVGGVPILWPISSMPRSCRC